MCNGFALKPLPADGDKLNHLEYEKIHWYHHDAGAGSLRKLDEYDS